MPTESHHKEKRAVGAHSPSLLVTCGLIGMIGCIAIVAGNAIGSMVVPGHDWVADTVSDLGAGKYEIIQDVGLYGYAASLLACAIGSAHYHLGTERWSWGILCLTVLALCVVIVGVRNEYGDGDDEGIVIHIYVVYTLGVFFTAAPLLMAGGMGREGAVYGWIALICAALWAIGAPVFFFLPTDVDGAWERGLGVITIVFIATLSWILYSAGRRISDD
jgi:hypothetical membrane protein